MRLLITSILLLNICFLTFKEVSFYALYYANQSYLSKEVCEKRNTKEAACCKGKCTIKKAIKASKEKNSNNPMPVIDFEQLEYIPTFSFLQNLSIHHILQHQFAKPLALFSQYCNMPLHPPPNS